MMTAAKATKTTPSKAARKVAPKTNSKTGPKPKPKPAATAETEPKSQADKEDEALAVATDCAERAADDRVRTLATASPLYMRTLLEHAPAWYAEDDADVVDERADKLTSDLLLLGGSQ